MPGRAHQQLRFAWLALAIASSALAQSTPLDPSQPRATQPPHYKPLRFDEDYSYLADPSKRTDPFDAVKYIPLDRSNADRYVSIGGEVRERIEISANPNFGLSGQRHDDYLLHRLMLHADLHFDEHVRAFVQGISAFQWGQDGPSPPSQTDVADLQQAFGELALGDRDRRFSLRAGRQAMSFGSSRLIAIRDGPDVHYAHDGVRGTLVVDKVTVDAFATRLVNLEKYQFDDWNSGQDLWGLYGKIQGTGPIKGVDLYYIGDQKESANVNGRVGSQTRHSIGARAFGARSSLDYDVEGVFQFGEFDGDQIRAWTVASDIGYTLSNSFGAPRIGLKADIASGGPDHPGGTISTFDPLLFKAPYFNEATLVRPSNLIDLHPSVRVSPTSATTLSAGYDILWRYSTQDGLYNTPGRVVIPGSANDSRSIGGALDATLEWQIDRHLSWTASYVHHFSGSFITGAGGKDVDFFGTWIDFKF